MLEGDRVMLQIAASSCVLPARSYYAFLKALKRNRAIARALLHVDQTSQESAKNPKMCTYGTMKEDNHSRVYIGAGRSEGRFSRKAKSCRLVLRDSEEIL